jgi:hypothetical protein
MIVLKLLSKEKPAVGMEPKISLFPRATNGRNDPRIDVNNNAAI